MTDNTEQKALQICEDSGDYIYEGSDERFHGRTGHFEVLEDMNCCAPTQNVLFAFQCGTSRKVMDADELCGFYKDCKKA